MNQETFPVYLSFGIYSFAFYPVTDVVVILYIFIFIIIM